MDSKPIRRTMAPKSRRVRWLSASSVNKYAPGVLTEFCTAHHHVECGEESRHNDREDQIEGCVPQKSDPHFHPGFMLRTSRVGIRDAVRRERNFLSLDDHTEYGDLHFVAPECLPEASGIPGPRLA
jgi:hypothetical protein